MIAQSRAWKDHHKTIGFVPTMGALHLGHQALLDAARAQADRVVLSIFVNPTQFNDPNDLAKYPKTLEADLALARTAGVDAVFLPTYEALYHDHYRYAVTENAVSKILCGADRPGHFDGVLSVVMKLLNIVAPAKAFFGEKDFQQLRLVRDMVDSFFMPVAIIGVPTVREADGLALSSRNKRLSAANRALAPEIFATISTAKSDEAAHEALLDLGFKVDYVSDIDGRRFVAVNLVNENGDTVRLIDNVKL
jgi:pantoate--beta-alanine ligase